VEHFLAEQAFNYIVSAQPFSVTIGSGSTSNTAAVNDVDTTRAFIVPAGSTCTGTAGRDASARVSLTNATTVTAARSNAGANTVTCRGTVVQLSPLLVKSVQPFSIALGSVVTTNTFTIIAVDTAKAAVISLGAVNAGTGTSITSQLCRVALTDATTVTAARNASGVSATAGGVVVEFQPWAVTGVQQLAATLTTANTSDTATLSPGVDPTRSLVFYGGSETASTTFSNSYYRAELTDATTVTLTRTGTAVASRTVNATVVEFAPGVLRAVRRGTVAVASATSADATIPFADEGKAWVHQAGFSATATSFPETHASTRFVNGTTVRSEKNTAGSTTSTPSYEAAWFN
jgi:hypothetical protein